MHPTSLAPFDPACGGCACGAVRFTLLQAPLYVHCCHCTRCQRETGGPFAHHAMVAWCDMRLDQGEAAYSQVPSDSGTRHWVARCAHCRTAMWNEWGSRRAVTRYVRVGVLDEPGRFPPQAHIFMKSRQAWLPLEALPDGVRGFDTYYPADHWPAESRKRWAEARRRWAAHPARSVGPQGFGADPPLS